MNLPEREWLPLPDVIKRIMDRCGCDRETAEEIGCAGLKDRILKLRAIGRCMYTDSPTIRYLLDQDLVGRTINWDNGRVGPYSHAEIRRFDLDVWLKEAGNGSAAKTPKNTGGRPLEYDWTTFDWEIIRIANLDGLPEKQAELVERMLQWCEDTWGNQPSDSAVKTRISRLYHTIGWGRRRGS